MEQPFGLLPPYIRMLHGTSFPAAPFERQLFYRDDLHQWFIYNGTAWVSLVFGGFNYIDLPEIIPPANPPADILRLYVEDFHGFPFFSFRDVTGMVRKIVRDSVFVARNVTGVTIPIGRAVYASGSSGNVPTIALARANALATMPAIGITVEAIANNAFGRVMQIGLLENTDTSAFAAGNVLYVSAVTAGLLTATSPLYPDIRQEMGTVLVSGIGNGAIQCIARSMTHTQGTDVALGALGTKNPPINADKVIYRDSAAGDALVTSTWTQIKAFLKTYFDTIYDALGAAAAVLATLAAHIANTAAGIHGSSVAAAINTLIHRDAAGRAQIANPAVNADIDNMGSRDAAIAAHTALTDTHGATGAIVGTTNAQTLTNKRNQPRVSSSASGNISPDVSAYDMYIRTAQAAALTINNPTGSPATDEKLIIRLKDNGTARAISWGGQYRGLEFALPATTVISKLLYMGFIYNSDDTKWDMVAINQEV